jgi:hypothetical protein
MPTSSTAHPEPVGDDGPEAEEAQGGVAAVARGQHVVVCLETRPGSLAPARPAPPRSARPARTAPLGRPK